MLELLNTFLGAFAKLGKENIIFVVSVCLRGTTPPPSGDTFLEIDIWVFYNILSKKLKFHYNLRRIKADSHIACRAHAVRLACLSAKGLECVFPI